MPDVTFDEIAAFVAATVRCPKEKITPDTRLAKDLGLDGDDAADFFEAFQHRFHVDLNSIQWSRHFGPEAPFMPWLLLWPPWWRWQKQKIEVRVSDLLAAASAGRWLIAYEKPA